MTRGALALLLLLAAAPVPAAEVDDAPPAVPGAEIGSYAVRLRLRSGGAGESSSLVHLAGASPGTLDLPLGFDAVSDLRLTAGPSGTRLAALQRNGRSILRVELPQGTPPELDLGFDLTVPGGLALPAAGAGGARDASPAGRLTFRHSFLSSQPGTVGRYRLVVVFPAGMRAHAIREALPRLRKGEAGPRARLEAIDGRAGARLEAGNLAQGETASLQIELERESRSSVWWIAGVALSLLYLRGFRDLVQRRS